MVKIVDKKRIVEFLSEKDRISTLGMVGAIENIDGSIFGKEADKIQLFVDTVEEPNYVIVKEHEYWHHLYYRDMDALKKAKKEYFDQLGEYGFDAVDETVYNFFKNEEKIEWVEACNLLYVDPNKFQFVQPEIDLVNCSIEEVDTVNDHYTYKDETSRAFIEDNIRNRPTSMYNVNGEAVAWVMVHRDNSLGIMYTKKEFRGKGVAYQLSMDILKKIIDSGKIPFIHIRVENDASMKLAEKCGFQFEKPVWWFGVEK